MSKTVKEYKRGGLKTSRLSLEKVEYAMSKLGPCNRMTPYELQEMLKDKVRGDSLSEEIIKMRSEGW